MIKIMWLHTVGNSEYFNFKLMYRSGRKTATWYSKVVTCWLVIIDQMQWDVTDVSLIAIDCGGSHKAFP